MADRPAPSVRSTLIETLSRYPIEPLALALVVGAMAAVMFSSHLPGHWWGDDWALYIRQAQSLLDGDPGTVAAENRFAVEGSLGSPFSPPLYPWGFPALLAPFIAVLGTEIDQLRVVPVLSAAVFACAWYLLARRRLGIVPALVGVGAVTLTPLLLGWSELIQSEWPFLAASGVALVAVDRVAAAGALLSGRYAALTLLGLGAAAAFSVRREGLAVTAAIAAAQLAALIAERPAWRDPLTRQRVLPRLAAPHVAALAAVGLVQVSLPSTLVPRYDGTSLTNAWGFAGDHVKHLAEVSGLKRPWETSPEVLDNTGIGWAAVVLYLGAAALGIVVALVSNRTRDVHLVGYVVVAFAIGSSFRTPINRYVSTVAPMLLLLGLAALTTIGRRIGVRRATTVATTMALAAITLGNLANANVQIERADQAVEAGAVEWGADHPDAQEMFAAVRRLTEPDDRVAAPKARAMTLETGRWAIQVDDARPIPSGVELALVVVEPFRDLAADLEAPGSGYEVVWRNGRFVLFQPSSAANASTNGAGSSSTASP